MLAACACAETVLRFVPTSEDRPRIAIETARAWAHGEASIEDVKKARDAAHACAVAAHDAVRASRTASAARVPYDADLAARSAYAVDQSEAIADYVYDLASYAGDRPKQFPSMAPLVRRYIPLSVLACSLIGARDPLPIPRDNPRRRTR